jgi:hypothetical protein
MYNSLLLNWSQINDKDYSYKDNGIVLQYIIIDMIYGNETYEC